MAGPPLGNDNAARGRESTHALEMALDKKGGRTITPIGRMKPLVEMWEKIIDDALTSGAPLSAVREITDRLDGKPRQSLNVGDPQGNPLSVTVNMKPRSKES